MARRTVVRVIGLTFLTVLMAPEPGDASGWTLRRGHLWAEFYWQRYVATRDFDTDGQPVGKLNDGRFREFRNELKIELPSWDDRFNVLVSVPFNYSRYVDRNVTLTNSGAQEASVGAKWRSTSVRAPVIVAVQTGVNFPLGCDSTDPVPLGDCQTDVEGRVVLSRRLHTDADGFVTAYVNGEVGYRLRRGTPTNELPFFIELASRLGSRPVWLKGFVDGVESRAPGSFEQEEDYSKWSASLMLGRDPVTRGAEGRRRGLLPLIEVGVGGVFAGKHTGVGRVVFVKFALQR